MEIAWHHPQSAKTWPFIKTRWKKTLGHEATRNQMATLKDLQDFRANRGAHVHHTTMSKLMHTFGLDEKVVRKYPIFRDWRTCHDWKEDGWKQVQENSGEKPDGIYKASEDTWGILQQTCRWNQIRNLTAFWLWSMVVEAYCCGDVSHLQGLQSLLRGGVQRNSGEEPDEICKMKMGQKSIFKQDSDPKHKAKATME